jgi:hypothetical protein
VKWRVTAPPGIAGMVVTGASWLEARGEVRAQIRKLCVNESRTMAALDMEQVHEVAPPAIRGPRPMSRPAPRVSVAPAVTPLAAPPPPAVVRYMPPSPAVPPWPIDPRERWKLAADTLRVGNGSARFGRARRFRMLTLEAAASRLRISVDEVSALEDGQLQGDWDKLIEALRLPDPWKWP